MPTRDELYARHEAAHAITMNELGWVVEWVDLDRRQTKPVQGFFVEVFGTNWNDPAQVEEKKSRVLECVTTTVAGFVGEHAVGSPELLVSARVQLPGFSLNFHYRDTNQIRSDRDRTVFLLQLIQLNTVEQILAAEQRAAEILAQRSGQFDNLVEKLLAMRVVNGADLEQALGNAAIPANPGPGDSESP